MNSVDNDKEVLDELGLSDTEAKILLSVIKEYDDEDKVERDRFIRLWKELELFFRGFQNLLWDDVSRDWIDPNGKLNTSKKDIDPEAYDKIVNIYRAHLESIIAAVTANTPRTKFFPEDADNPDDIKAAKTSVKVVEKIERDNSMALKFIHALFIMVNQGLVFAHTYYHSSDEYGTISKPVEGIIPGTTTKYYCEFCGNEVEGPEPQMCENCGEKTTPMDIEEESEELGEIDSIETPKGKACIDIYGPLFVKVPINLTSLKYTPYLRLETDQHIAFLEEVYPHLKGKLNSGVNEEISTEKRGRNPNPTGSNNENQETLKIYWLRPWALNIYGNADEEEVEELKARYPNGIKVSTILGQIAEIKDENLDDHWTATESPLASTLHADPYGKPLKAIQQMENELVRLILQTIQFGIPELFADPRIVDFKAYAASAAKPGMMYPIKVPVGERAESKFFRNQPATLSKEVGEFQQYLEMRAQFLSANTAAVWGGPAQGGSGTFSEYEMSRNQALQRLQILWKTINDWYPRFMAKATKSFIKNMQGDESYVKQQGNGFVNEHIRQEDLEGKVGEAFSESSEQFPVTWPQIRGMIMELLGMNKQFIDAALAHPENVGFMAKAFGMGGLVIPGSQDRDKELRIIQELLNETPQEIPDPMFQPPPPNSEMMMDNPQAAQMIQPPMIPAPSIRVNNEIDNHPVCIATLQHWAVSEAGIAAEKANPAGFQNVMLHLKEHMLAIQMQQGGGPGGGGKPPNPEAAGAEGIPPVDAPPDDVAGLA